MRNMFLPVSAVLLIIFVTPYHARANTTKTLIRHEDFAVMKGADLEPLLGAQTGDIRLYACKGAVCSPKPVQVDKLDSLERYVFPEEINSDRDGTAFDANDEVSFMAEDSGDRAPAGWKPGGAAAGMEIELVDPLDGGKAWLYIFNEPGSEPPEVPDYVSYRRAGDYVVVGGDRFEIGYMDGSLSYDMLRMSRPGVGLSPDILDRQRMGLEAEMAGDVKIPFKAPDSIIKQHDIGVIDGPIRVIVDQVVKVQLLTISVNWGTEYFIKFYRCGQNNSCYYEFPISVNEIWTSILFYWGLDMTRDVLGSYYIDPNHPEPVILEDREQEGLPGDAGHYWWGLYGEHGAVMMALDLQDNMEEYFVCDARWKFNPDPTLVKGDHPGRYEVAFACHEAGEMPEEKQYHYFNYILIPRDPTPEGIEALRNIYENPLAITAAPR